MSEQADRIAEVARQRGWSGPVLRASADVVGLLLGRGVAEAVSRSFLEGLAFGVEPADELDEGYHSEARAIEVRRRRADAGAGLQQFLHDMRAAADQLDAASGRDLAGELEVWLREHGPASAAEAAKAIRARATTVREVLTTDERFSAAVAPPGRAANARLYFVSGQAGRAGPVAGTGGSAGDANERDDVTVAEMLPAPPFDPARPWDYPGFRADVMRWIEGEGDEQWRASVSWAQTSLRHHLAERYAHGAMPPDERRRFEEYARKQLELLDAIAADTGGDEGAPCRCPSSGCVCDGDRSAA